MKLQTRLVTVILAGILVGVIAVRLQKNTGSVDRGLISMDDATRKSALTALRAMKSEKKGEVVGLLSGTHVKNPDPRVRVFALYALRKSGFTGPRVVGSLARALGDKDENVRKEATVGLMEIGTAGLGAMINMMQDPAIRGLASDLVRTLPPESIVQLRAALSAGPQQKRGAAFVVSKIERPDTLEKARELLPQLSALLTSTDTVVAVNAAFAIHAVDAADVRPTPVFIASLQKPNWDAWDVRGWDALEALSDMPSTFPQVFPLLRKLLPGAEDGLAKNRRFKRPAIADALIKMAPRDGSMSARVADLKSRDAAVRWRTVYEVGQAKQVDVQYMGPLVALLDDPDTSTAARAFQALDRMGMKNTERAAATVYPKLIGTFQRVGGAVPGFWIMAATSLGAIGQPIVPPVLDAVKAKKLDPHKGASVIRAMRTESAPIDALKRAFASDDDNLRIVAAVGLAKFAPRTEGLQVELERQLPRHGPPFTEEIQRALTLVKKA